MQKKLHLYIFLIYFTIFKCAIGEMRLVLIIALTVSQLLGQLGCLDTRSLPAQTQAAHISTS